MSAQPWAYSALIDYIRTQWEDQAASVINQIQVWVDRGDGVAVYENHDMGHPEVGMPKIVSYGSNAAQLETDDPPTTLPDGIPAGAINWRFQLIATYRTNVPRDTEPVGIHSGDK